MKFKKWVESKINSEIIEKILMEISLFNENEQDFTGEEFGDNESIGDEEEHVHQSMTGDEDAAPIASYDPDDEEENRKKTLIRNARLSMQNLRYKAKLERRLLIRKLRELGQADDEILSKLGYDPNKPNAFQAATSETGNGVPKQRLQLLLSKSLDEFRKEFQRDLSELYIYSAKGTKNPYALFGDSKYSNEFGGELTPLEKIEKSLTTRTVNKSINVANPWSKNPAEDKQRSAIMRFTNTVIDNVRKNSKVERKKEIAFGAAREDEDYKDTIASATSKSSATDDEEIKQKIKTIFDKLAVRFNNPAGKPKLVAFLLSYGLDDIAQQFLSTGSLNIPEELEISIAYKINKSGSTSTKMDFEMIIEKLRQYGIMTNKPQLSSWFNTIKQELNQYRSELGIAESFSSWLALSLLY